MAKKALTKKSAALKAVTKNGAQNAAQNAAKNAGKSGVKHAAKNGMKKKIARLSGVHGEAATSGLAPKDAGKSPPPVKLPSTKTITREALEKLLAPPASGGSSRVLDRLWDVVMERRYADPAISHSARLFSRGMPKIAQKFGEEAVECVIEAVSGNGDGLVAESADVLYHLLVVWAAAGIHPSQVWAELERREGVSGIAEKAARRTLTRVVATRKIP